MIYLRLFKLIIWNDLCLNDYLRSFIRFFWEYLCDLTGMIEKMIYLRSFKWDYYYLNYLILISWGYLTDMINLRLFSWDNLWFNWDDLSEMFYLRLFNWDDLSQIIYLIYTLLRWLIWDDSSSLWHWNTSCSSSFLRMARHRQIVEPQVVAESSEDSDEGTWHPEREESSEEEEEEEEEEVDDEVAIMPTLLFF